MSGLPHNEEGKYQENRHSPYAHLALWNVKVGSMKNIKLNSDPFYRKMIRFKLLNIHAGILTAIISRKVAKYHCKLHEANFLAFYYDEIGGLGGKR